MIVRSLIALIVCTVISVRLLGASPDHANAATLVEVIANGERCVVKGKEFNCKAIAKYLRERMRVPLTASIGVADGDHVDSDVLQRIVAELKQAGFTDVQAL